jgi:hypothetical protein
MLDDLSVDDGYSPAIGLVPAGVPWEEVRNHIKIGHDPLLVLAPDSGLRWQDWDIRVPPLALQRAVSLRRGLDRRAAIIDDLISLQ